MMEHAHRPTVGFILGDPSGIGPEIVLKLLQSPRTYKLCYPVLIGNHELLCAAIARYVPSLLVTPYRRGMCAATHADGQGVPMADVGGPAREVALGRVTAAGGQIAYLSIVAAYRMLEEGLLDGVVMAPVNKAALHCSGCGFDSEYELFAKLAGVEEVRTVVKGGAMFRSTVIGHVPFREIMRRLTTQSIVHTGKGLYRVMNDFGIPAPVMAVAALNPHGGEDGEWGLEETEIILPAIEALRALGMDVRGPFPADTIYPRALKYRYDGIVHLYHDQGNIAMKTQMFESTAIMYVDVPYPILSTGHGSALDIADLGVANPTNIAYVLGTLAELLRRAAK